MRRLPPCDSILTVLSTDLLIQILDRVADAGDRKAWRLVCSGFLRAEELHRRSIRVLRREDLPSLLVRYAAALERLDLSACPALDDAALAGALATGAGRWRIRSVDLGRASGLGWRGLRALVAACPLLEAVDLAHCVRFGDREAAALAEARGLREVRLDKCLRLTDVGLAQMSVACPALERLSAKWCMEISDIGIDLLVKKCRDLRALDVSYLKITNKSLESISSLGKLEVLNMVGCSNIDDDGLKFLNNGNASLQFVDFSRCENVTSVGFASVIQGHKRLKKLNFGNCFYDIEPTFLSKLSVLRESLTVLKLDGFQVSASILRTIGVSCKNLSEIGLGKCSGVTDEGISELVRSCSRLTTIDLTCSHLLTDKGLTALADQCKNLLCIRLESCNLITEKGLDRIGTSCSNLEEIDLTDCSITDVALKHLSRCSKLTVLKLGLCDGISDEGLFYIASKCKMLRELDLYRCTEITDGGLAALATGCRNLQKLNICYCKQITDQGLNQLSYLKGLRELELRSLARVTSLGIITIAIGCKGLIELDLKRCSSIDDAGFCALAQYTENLRQINISHCRVSGVGLCNLLGTLKCLQDVDLVNLSRVQVEELELALRACCGRLKKLKLVTQMKQLLSPRLILMLQALGCRIRWVYKPVVLGP